MTKKRGIQTATIKANNNLSSWNILEETATKITIIGMEPSQSRRNCVLNLLYCCQARL